MKHILSSIKDKLRKPQAPQESANAAPAEKKQPKFLRKKKLTPKKLILLGAGAVILIGGGILCYQLFFTEEEAVALTDFTISEYLLHVPVE